MGLWGRGVWLSFLAVLLPLAGCPRPGPEETATGGVTSTGTSTASGGTGGVGGGVAMCADPPKVPFAEAQRSYKGLDEEARGAAFDAEGNLYVVGYYSGNNAQLVSGTNLDGPVSQSSLFLVKYNAQREYETSIVIAMEQYYLAFASLAVDPITNDIVVAGEFSGTINLGGEQTTGDSDIFTARFHDDLSLVWGKTYIADDKQFPSEVAFDSDGNILLTGSSRGALDFSTAPCPVMSGTSGTFSFVAKFDGAGVCQWSRSYDLFAEQNWSDYLGFGTALAIAPNDDVLFGGNVYGTAILPDGTQPQGQGDGFLACLKPDGSLKWARSFNGGASGEADGDQWITSIAVGPSAPGKIDEYDIHVVGAFTKHLAWQDGSPTDSESDTEADGRWEPDIFLARLHPDATTGVKGPIPTRVEVFGGAGWQEVSAVRISPTGEIALVGILADSPSSATSDVDFRPPICELSAPTSRVACSNICTADGFVALLQPDGEGIWGYRFGNDAEQVPLDAAIDQNGTLSVVGWFEGEISASSGQSMNATVADMFVFWYDAPH